MMPRLLPIFIVLFTSPLLAVPPDAQTKPDDARAADAGKAIAGFKHPEGTTVTLFAAEPLLAGPVAFDVDVDGKVYVAETDRFDKGVADNRGHGYWLLDDLAANTLADRQAYYDKWIAAGKKKPDWFTSHADQVRVLVDADGDGKADSSHVLAKFNESLDGVGSGVLADRGTIYYTNIPHLWKLRDADGDGTAEVREKLSTGYGIRTALLGHDLHGLTWGPDGKLYFSVGDRGFNITTTAPGSKTLRDPMDVGRGAVFRCNADGSDLEVFAWGLRNPQELAFDDYGNLWTGDNNSDAGDAARLVYVVEQGDSGWAMSFQTLDRDNSRGPWNQEKLWHTRHENQPAWIIPPVAHVTSGPSGFVHYPGLGLGDKYRGHFFLADFRGGAGNSGVVSFTVTPDGAGFTMSKPEQFVWNMLVTDVDFGYDGRVYLSDWVNGWNPRGQGRMYTLQDDEAIKDPRIAELTKLMREGFDQRSVDELIALLGHADQRVRLAAQFELVKRKASDDFEAVIRDQTASQLKRIHAIWGYAQIPDSKGTLLCWLLDSNEPEIAAQAARVVGDRGEARSYLMKLVREGEPRVRYQAAMALGKVSHDATWKPKAIATLIQLLRENDDKDVYLRHAAVVALWRIGDADAVLAHADDSSKAVRLGVLLTLRRMQDARIARYLRDTDRSLVIEAARAIYDLQIDGATGQLADMLSGDLGPLNDDRQTTFALHRRVINAAYRRGTAADAARLAAYAADGKNPQLMRREALEALSDFATPPPRERVLGFHRPLPPRDASLVAAALQPALADLLKTDLNAQATALASKYHVTLDPAALAANVADDKAASALRVASLEALADMKAPQLNDAIVAALKSGDLHLRCAARDVLARFDANRAIAELDRVLASGHPAERQRALATLAAMKHEKADALIVRSVDGVLDGSLVAEARLDAIQAARARADASAPVKAALSKYDATTNLADPMTTLAIAKVGGDAARGRQLYLSHAAAQCQRCHRIDGVGGEAGPDLSKIGSTRDRDYLLRALANPQAEIAEGFGTIALTLKGGSTVAGVIRSEAGGKITLLTPDGKTAEVNAADVTQRSDPISAMPPMGFILRPAEVRDVIEYLSTLR